MRPIASGLAVVCGAAALVASGEPPAMAAAARAEVTVPIVVTTTRDAVDERDGLLSLREAVILASRRGGADTIRLAAGAEYLLEAPCPTISDNRGLTDDLDHRAPDPLTVLGSGATIRQSPAVTAHCNFGEARVLETAGGALILDHVTITGGRSIDPCAGSKGIGGLTCRGVAPDNGPGGGVRARGPVLVRSSTIAGNEAVLSRGGGVWSDGRVTVVDSTIAENRAAYAGGLGSPIAVRVMGSTVRDNTAAGCGSFCGGGSGGGIGSDGRVTVIDTTVRANTARRGGGIAAAGLVTVRRSTVAANRARGEHWPADRWAPEVTRPGQGGGVATDGPIVVRNATISANRVRGWVDTADGLTPAAGSGGGLWAGGGLDIVHATVADNRADEGSNLFVDTGAFRAFGSAIGLGRPGATSCRFGGATASDGYNVVAGGTCGFGPGLSDLFGVTSLAIGPLQDNGGPTLTRRPVDATLSIVPAAACTRTTTDQRRRHRPNGPNCEAGSVEVG